MNRKPRLLIADSHQVVADACKRMLEPEFEVVDVVADGRALVKSAPQLKPDGAVLEAILPQLKGIDVAQQLKQKLPMLKLMLITANPDVNAAAEAFRSGASAYLSKHSGAAGDRDQRRADSIRVEKAHFASPGCLDTNTDLAGTRFMEMPEETRDLLGSARGDGERQRQLKGAARTRQRTEDRYATDIQ